MESARLDDITEVSCRMERVRSTGASSSTIADDHRIGLGRRWRTSDRAVAGPSQQWVTSLVQIGPMVGEAAALVAVVRVQPRRLLDVAGDLGPADTMAFAIVDVRQLHSEKRAQQVLKQPVVGFSGERQAMGFRGFGTGAELVPWHPVSVRPDVPLARRVDDAAALRLAS